MRYRKVDATGDRIFGAGQAAFWRDQPEAVAGAIQSRLALKVGDWFADTAAGTDWDTRVLGERTRLTRDFEIRDRILGTSGATEIESFSSAIDASTRTYSYTATVATDYGSTSSTGTV